MQTFVVGMKYYYMKLVVGALEIFEASRAEIGPSLYHTLIRPSHTLS
jgi:hypothetical protein